MFLEWFCMRLYYMKRFAKMCMWYDTAAQSRCCGTSVRRRSTRWELHGYCKCLTLSSYTSLPPPCRSIIFASSVRRRRWSAGFRAISFLTRWGQILVLDPLWNSQSLHLRHSILREGFFNQPTLTVHRCQPDETSSNLNNHHERHSTVVVDIATNT